MKSKTSCFSAGIFRNNCIRFWPVWTLYLALLFFLVPVRIYSIGSHAEGNDPSWTVQQALNTASMGFSVFLVFLFSILSAASVYAYLFSSRSCNMTHAFPLKRSQLFVTNCLSGLLFLVVPQILAALTAVPGFLRLEIPARIMGVYLLHALGYDVIFFTVAVFCCMLAGHLLSAIVYYFVLNGVYIVSKCLFLSFQNLCGYGLSGYGLSDYMGTSPADVLSPLPYLLANSGVRSNPDPNAVTAVQQLSGLKISGGGIIAGFCAASILLLLAAFWLYRKRQLECAGEMSAFAVMNPVMRWIISICGGMFFAFFFIENILDLNNLLDSDKAVPFILCFAVLSFIWFFVTEMILKKRFKVFGKKRWLEWIACGTISVLLLCAINADMFHVVRYVPPISQIKGAVVSGNYSLTADKDSGLNQVIRLHHSILDHQEEYQEIERRMLRSGLSEDERPDPSEYVTISYFLKDGSIVHRHYMIPVTEEELRKPDSAISLLDTLETPESVLRFILGSNYEAIQFNSGAFNGGTFDQEQTAAIYDALRLDLQEGHLHCYSRDAAVILPGDDPWSWNSGVDVSLYGVLNDREAPVTLPFIEEGYEYFTMNGSMRNLEPAGMSTTQNPDGSFTTTVHASFYINPDCTHTIDVLTQYGLADGPATVQEMQERIYSSGSYDWRY